MIYLQLFLVFAKIGIFGFGGGMAMLPMIYQSAEQFQLMGQDEFSNLVAIAQVTPGPIAVNAATYVGYNCAGFLGAAVATLGVAFPSFVFVTIVFHFLSRFRDSQTVEGAFYGVRPVTVGLIASAMIFVGQSAFPSADPILILLFLAALGAIATRKVSPAWIILGAGVAGAIFCRP